MSDARGVRRSRSEEEEESYFVSMADMMVGLLFIFIILLLYFALQFRQNLIENTGANNARKELLSTLKDDLDKRGVQVQVDDRTGVLRLPDELLFPSARFELSPTGFRKVQTVANAIADVLPCYSEVRGRGDPLCPPERRSDHRLESIFIEGHTDSKPLTGADVLRDNLDLSALRATRTFKTMMDAQPSLGRLTTPEGVPLFGVSGYGERRPNPSARGSAEQVDQANRRIDLRFVMVTPQSEAEATLTGALAKK